MACGKATPKLKKYIFVIIEVRNVQENKTFFQDNTKEDF